MRDSRGSGTESASALTLFVPQPGSTRSVEVPLRFVVRESDFYVAAPRDPLPGWAESLQRSPTVRWRVSGQTLSGTASLASDNPETARGVLAELAARYGRNRVERWFGPEATVFRLRPSADLGPSEPGLVERHFDAIAHDYDRMVASNPLDRGLRDAALDILLRTFRRGDRVLEIGSGTGLETLPLARAGIRVLATDLSEAMLDRLREKARDEGLSEMLETRKLPLLDVSSLVGELGPQAFQGAFSDFGPFNVEPEWARAAPSLAELIEPGGHLVLAVWNQVCVSEMALYALGLRPRRALARLRSPVPVGLSRFGVPAYAHPAGRFLRAFRPWFDVERLLGLPVAVPPYDFLPHLRQLGYALPVLEAVDRRIGWRFPFNRFGDHFVTVLRRK